MTLRSFFLFTFALTWVLWLAIVTPRSGAFFGFGGPVFLLGVFAPAIVALALTARAEGRVGVSRLLSRIGIWRVRLRWYVFALSYLITIKLAAAVIHRMTGGTWPAFGETSLPVMLGAIALSTWVQAGEEVGWRGYALPRLAQRFGLGLASVVLGIIWALWHLPLFLLPGSDSAGQSFPIYLLHVTALSVAMAWLYWKTGGSLLLVMVMHAAVNNTTGIVPAAVPGAANAFSLAGSPVAWIIVVLSWLVAAPLLVLMRSADPGAMIDQESSRRR